MSRICPFCGRILLDQRLRINDLAVAAGGENAAKLLNLTVPGRLGDIWHLDEVFVTIQGQRRYLWRAVDQDGDVIDILVQSRRDCRAATRFFRKLLKGQERTPGRLVTDKLSSYRGTVKLSSLAAFSPPAATAKSLILSL